MAGVDWNESRTYTYNTELTANSDSPDAVFMSRESCQSHIKS